jgi:hypothetical protein
MVLTEFYQKPNETIFKETKQKPKNNSVSRKKITIFFTCRAIFFPESLSHGLIKLKKNQDSKGVELALLRFL